MLEVNGWLKMSEVDDYNEGCLPDSCQMFSSGDRFTGENQQDLVQKLMDFVGTSDADNVTLNACEEVGRIDIQLLEDADGAEASVFEIEMWKKGEKKLWAATYTFQVEEVERKPFELKETE